MEKFSTKHNWAKAFASILCIVLFSVTSLFSQTTVFVEDFNTWGPGPTLGTWTFESYDPATGAAISAPLGAWNYNGIAYDPPFSAYHDWWAGNSAGGYPAYNDWMISPEIDRLIQLLSKLPYHQRPDFPELFWEISGIFSGFFGKFRLMKGGGFSRGGGLTS